MGREFPDVDHVGVALFVKQTDRARLCTEEFGTGFRNRLAGREEAVLIADDGPYRHLVETELVALDVLHHKARLVDAIGRQQSHAYRAERDQSCAFGL